MKNFKKLWAYLMAPSIFFSIIYSIIAVLVIAFTIILLCLGYTDNIFCYVLYALSAIFLTYLVYIVIYFTPRIKESIIKFLKSKKFTNELLESYGYRSLVFATFSFCFNLLYAFFQAVIALISRSIWFGALAFYYIVITLIRGRLVFIARKKSKNKISFEKQIKSYRNSGIYLLVLNFALVGAIVQMVISNQSFNYAGLLIYVMATYAFYKLGISIYNLIKAKKHQDYTIRSIKNLGFADSLVSILALQTALFQAFAEGYTPYLPNALVGGAVSIIIITLAIIMVVHGQINLKKHKEESLKNE